MWKNIESVKRGEVIVEGRNKEIKVGKVEPYACSSLGTHVNGSMCYDRGTQVRTKDKVNPAETGLGDLEEDNLLAALMGGLTGYLESPALNPNSPFTDQALFRTLAAQRNSSGRV